MSWTLAIALLGKVIGAELVFRYRRRKSKA